MRNDTENRTIGNENRLGQIIKRAREQNKIFQTGLAEKLGVKSSTISNFEKGQRLPSIAQLTKLSNVLDLDIQSLILCRTFDEVSSDQSSNWPPEVFSRRKDLLRDIEKHIVEAEHSASVKSERQFKGRTFLDFPEAFPRIKIVTGDRRENPPKTVGDIGAYSASPIDDRWLCSLGLPKDTEKISDKEFVLSSEEDLRKKYGNCTLLVLGSPAGNHLARIINASAIFRFNYQKGYEEALENVLRDRTVEKTGDSKPQKKDEHLKDLKRKMVQFFAFGIIDPVYTKSLRAFALSGSVDYATVTFATNPFREEDDFKYIAIMVAGFHHPGTIWALRRLSEPHDDKDGFKNRPYGGVLKVDIDTEAPWEDRMSSAKCSWDTDPYTKDELLKGLDDLKKRESSLMQVDFLRTEECKRLLCSL